MMPQQRVRTILDKADDDTWAFKSCIQTWRREEEDGVVCAYVNIGAVEQHLCVARPFSVSNTARDLCNFIAYRNLSASQYGAFFQDDAPTTKWCRVCSAEQYLSLLLEYAEGIMNSDSDDSDNDESDGAESESLDDAPVNMDGLLADMKANEEKWRLRRRVWEQKYSRQSKPGKWFPQSILYMFIFRCFAVRMCVCVLRVCIVHLSA
jgi:hypothetical protein